MWTRVLVPPPLLGNGGLELVWLYKPGVWGAWWGDPGPRQVPATCSLPAMPWQIPLAGYSITIPLFPLPTSHWRSVNSNTPWSCWYWCDSFGQWNIRRTLLRNSSPYFLPLGTVIWRQNADSCGNHFVTIRWRIQGQKSQYAKERWEGRMETPRNLYFLVELLNESWDCISLDSLWSK